MKIYLAGKIAKNDWRQPIVSDCELEFEEDEIKQLDEYGQFPVAKEAIFGKHDYMGPFFIACDHGCCHGPATHGAGESVCYGGSMNHSPQLRRDSVKSACLQAIDRSDVVFAWIEGTDCYGTIAELGYAHGKGKCLLLAFKEGMPESDSDELWFVRSLATHCMESSRPVEALKLLLRRVPTGKERRL